MGRKKSRSYRTGSYGCTVTVESRTTGGNFYLRWYDSKAREGQGGPRWKSLGHKDWSRAIRAANELSEKLARDEKLEDVKPTLILVFREYLRHQSPKKKPKGRESDRRCANLWLTFLEEDKDPHLVSREEWDRFIIQRSNGTIDARGRLTTDPRPVGPRTVQADLEWLKIVLNWASGWSVDGQYLMERNPVRGYVMPREKNPSRPVATREEYQKLLEVSDQVHMEFRWDGKRTRTTSFLRELLILANDTGRRISAICQLTWNDVFVDAPRPDGLGADIDWFGVIRWPASTDKRGREWVTPLTWRTHEALRRVAVRCAIERRRSSSGPGLRKATSPVFPTSENPDQPINRYQATCWAAKAAKIARVEWKGWHSFRRRFASDRRNLAPVDVAAAGGWGEVRTMQECYQQADMESLVRVMNLGVEAIEQNAVQDAMEPPSFIDPGLT